MTASPHDNNHDGILPPFARAVAPYWLLALAVFAAYINIFSNSFLFDDDLIIKIDSYLQDWHHIGDILTKSTTSGAHIAGGFYRPIQILSYLIAYHLGAGTEFWFHTLNLVLHIANTCLVYRLGAKLGFNRLGVFLAALIWALHPLHTEAVTYMSGTADPLFVFFTLTAIVILLPDISQQKILAVMPLFLFALVSKETAAMFPLLVTVCLFFTNEKRFDYRIYLRTWPLWIVTCAFVYWRMHAPGFDGPQTYQHIYSLPSYANLKLYTDHPLFRIYTFLATLPAYLQLLFYPTGLHLERDFPIFVAFSGPAVAGFVITVIAAAQVIISSRHLKRSPRNKSDCGFPLSWGLLWFAAAHAPDSGLLITMNSLFLEHWMYLPTVGLFLGSAETIARLLHGKSQLWIMPVVISALVSSGALALKTHNQNKIWHDPESFYTDMFSYGVLSARARNNLALYYSDKGQYEKSIEQFNDAIKVADVYAETRFNLALTYLHLPDQREHADIAIENLKRSIDIDPKFYRSYQTLGDVYGTLLHDQKQGDYYHTRAKELLEEATQ